MNIVEKKKAQAQQEAKLKIHLEELEAYARAWRAISSVLGDELSDLILDSVVQNETKRSKEDGKIVKDIFDKYGFRRCNPEQQKKTEPVQGMPVDRRVTSAQIGQVGGQAGMNSGTVNPGQVRQGNGLK